MLIGHAGHEEVVGTTGQAPRRTILVQDVQEARTVPSPGPGEPLVPHADDALVDETNEIIGVLRERWIIAGPLGRTSATRRRTGGTP